MDTTGITAGLCFSTGTESHQPLSVAHPSRTTVSVELKNKKKQSCMHVINDHQLNERGGTWLFFNQLIIIVLCSFDSRQFPEINEKNKNKKKTTVVPKTWRVMHCGLLPVSRSGTLRTTLDRQKPSTARMIRPIALAHPFSITSMSSFIVLKVVSFPFK